MRSNPQPHIEDADAHTARTIASATSPSHSAIAARPALTREAATWVWKRPDSTRTDSGAWRLVATLAPQAVEMGDQRPGAGIVRFETQHLARGAARLVEIAHLVREPGQLVPAGAHVGEAGQHLAIDLLGACEVSAQRLGGRPLAHDPRAGLDLGEAPERRRRAIELAQVGEPPAE